MSTVPSHHQWLNDQWLINYHFKIWCLHFIWANLWRRDTCHVGTLWSGYRGVPRHRFYSIFIQFLHVFFIQVSCSFFILYTSTHFLIDWQPSVGILLLHINLCLLVHIMDHVETCGEWFNEHIMTLSTRGLFRFWSSHGTRRNRLKENGGVLDPESGSAIQVTN